jgi:predicted nuclease of restriction endonuclease-like RecB superfamily
MRLRFDRGTVVLVDPAPLERKLASLRKAALTNLILCIYEERNCAESEMRVGAMVVRFRRRIDAAAVLAVVERQIDRP